MLASNVSAASNASSTRNVSPARWRPTCCVATGSIRAAVRRRSLCGQRHGWKRSVIASRSRSVGTRPLEQLGRFSELLLERHLTDDESIVYHRRRRGERARVADAVGPVASGIGQLPCPFRRVGEVELGGEPRFELHADHRVERGLCVDCVIEQLRGHRVFAAVGDPEIGSGICISERCSREQRRIVGQFRSAEERRSGSDDVASVPLCFCRQDQQFRTPPW